ncbi:hypothetical protein GB931_07475 [Modestobacter sp. I12A-02628]|uniref:Uncharacterized protein n=1 Tax=Goekera deserti TaxID=2497753 RepID=A0A7K3WJC3_9ACTN|nr:hypothetical protein [Goekera deserti]MPQ97763.1 hypothetical protein [Goekera deserti]NDI48408.1 hypothetical protein [Goekera deserti]NEL56009.1 hypothetical protein [Goekera deserti]
MSSSTGWMGAAPGELPPPPGPDAGPAPTAGEATLPDRTGQTLLSAMAGTAGVTAVLCLLAPLLQLYTTTYGTPGDIGSSRQVVTGWHIRLLDLSGLDDPAFDSDLDFGTPVRYGLVLLVPLAVLVAGTVAALLPCSRVWGPALAATGGGTVAGVSLVWAVQLLAVRADSTAFGDASYPVAVALGAGGWLLLFAGALGVAVAVLALLLTAWLLTAAAGTAPAPAGWAPPVPGAWGPPAGPAVVPAGWQPPGPPHPEPHQDPQPAAPAPALEPPSPWDPAPRDGGRYDRPG